MKRIEVAFFILVVTFVALGVWSNLKEQKAIDKSKIPQKVEESRQFQRWITNLKNKGLEIEADEFRLQEEVEIFNTKWMKVFSLDDENIKFEFEKKLEENKETDKIVYSPSDKEFLDFRNIEREGYLPNEVRFYGQKEDKLLDLRAVDCSTRANCYFDRAYFMNNDVFVVTELSRNINKKDQTTEACETSAMCEYTFKLHLIDLVNNSRLVYESKPFEVVFDDFLPEL